MPEITPTSIQDCMTIARAFEKGANFAMTEESVFAVMSPRLSTMRSVAKATKRSMAAKAADTKDPSLLRLASGDAEAVADLIKECFPCKLRIDFQGKMNIASLIDPTSVVDAAGNALQESATANLVALKNFYIRALEEINEIIDMFKNLDKFVDLCAFKKFFTEFVCVPDLQRLLALLTAFLMKLAMEINGIFSLILSLFAPLLLPFLTSLVDTLTQFILAAIKPIECIIENISKMLTKLDYNVLFENIDQLKVSIGPKQGKPERPVDIKLPLFGTIAQTQDPAQNYDRRGRAIEFNLNPLGEAVANNKRAKVAEAENELDALQQASLRIDGANQKAADENRAQITAAKNKLAQAESERDLSAIGKANQALTSKFASMKGALFSMLAMLRRAAAEIEAYIRKVIDELTKMLVEFCGGGASAIALLGDKLQIVQLMALIVAIISAIKSKPKCDDEGQETQVFVNQLNLNDSFTIWTDDDQNVHIDEKDDGIKAAIDDVVKVFGAVPPSEREDDNRQKLKSLVKFTGDPALDTSISRTVDALTTPQKVKFKCPLQTSVAKAETVNKWIKELNVEQ